MINELILRVDYNGQTYDLIVDNEVPLRIDMSAVESQEFGKFFGVGSQTFSLPGTKQTNRFFNYAYDVSTDDIPAFYNTLDCSVILNGETILIGALQLIRVVSNDEGFVTYEVQVADKVLQFQEALATKLIKNADFTAYSHSLSAANITGSWDDNLLGGSVYYPVVDYGRTDNDKVYGQAPVFQLDNFEGFVSLESFIGNPDTPIDWSQWQPAMKLKSVMDVIFDQVGFTYTGSFTATDDFDQLYVLNKPNDGLGVGTPNFTGLDASDSSVMSSMTSGIYYPLNFVGPVDPSNSFNPATDTYTVPVTGDYSMYGSFDAIVNPVNPGNSPVTFNLTWEINGTPQLPGVSQILTTGGSTPTLSLPSETFSLTVGDTIRLVLKATYGGTALTSFPYQGTWTIPNETSPVTYKGADVDMSQQWPKDTKSVDILKGILQQFNLIMVPEPNNKSVIRIEQFDAWTRSGEIKDWTEKYDTAKRIGIQHTVESLEREVLFQNVDDADRFSKTTKESDPGYQYGTRRALAENNISQGSKTLDTYFAPVVLGGCVNFLQSDSATAGSYYVGDYLINTTTSFIIPHMYKFENSKQAAFSFKPRLGYKVDNQLPSGSSFYIKPDTGITGIEIQDTYTTIGNVNTLPVAQDITRDLHFDSTYTPFTFALNLNNGISNFDAYWKTYYDSLYWEGAKIVTLDLFFNEYEYKDIQLNDRILIKGQAFRINKISGFNVSHRDVVKVELIKLYPAYWQL